jgi:uncharacterized surface protein with fasciclin (FAS1) repeats
MNLKRFLNFMKHALLIAMVLTTIGITSCDDDDGGGGPKIFNGTVLALMSDSKYKESATVLDTEALDSLAKYVNMFPELQALLSGSADVTLFAPSNKAFKNLLATPGFPANINLVSPDIIKSVLAYHIVNGVNLKADLSAGEELSTNFTDPLSPSAAQKITVNSNGTLKAAPNATNTDIDIVVADQQAENGVLHIVESVMIPPSTGAVLVPILGKVAGTILLGKDFTNLAKVIMAADAAHTEDLAGGDFDIVTMLAMPISTGGAVTDNAQGITFIAPPNSVQGTPVFSETVMNNLLALSDKGRSIILNHLIFSGQYTVADAPANNPLNITKFSNGANIVPASDKTITVSVSSPSTQNPYGVALSNTPGTPETFRPIVVKDLAHSNGVVQVYAGVLQ